MGQVRFETQEAKTAVCEHSVRRRDRKNSPHTPFRMANAITGLKPSEQAMRTFDRLALFGEPDAPLDGEVDMICFPRWTIRNARYP